MSTDDNFGRYPRGSDLEFAQVARVREVRDVVRRLLGRAFVQPQLPRAIREALHATLAEIDRWGETELDALLPPDPMGDE